MSAPSRQLGVIGWPTVRSYSPVMQEAAFAALGLGWRYGAWAVRPVRLAEAIRGAAALGFVGLNVTVPHKEAVMALCAPDAAAWDVGAVNTLVYREGDPRPRGLNTDVHGFRMQLRETGVTPLVSGHLCVVLGAGGAARAVVRVLLDEGAVVAVVSRSSRRVHFRRSEAGSISTPGATAHALAPAGSEDKIGSEVRTGSEDEAPARLSHHPWTAATLATLLPHASLVVDTTPRGFSSVTSPDPSPEAPLDLALLSPAAAVIDLVVGPTTPLVEAARARGIRSAHTGSLMLVHQGARALEAWSGLPAPVDVMRAALAAALAADARCALAR